MTRLVSWLSAAGVAVAAYAVVAYLRVVAPAGPPTDAAVTSALGGLVLTVALSLSLVAVTVGSNTAISLELLTEKARRMENGDMDVRLDTDRGDEFGALARSLASMRDSLRRRIDEAERRRRETERRNEHMQAKAEHYEATLEAVIDGDLSQRVDADSRNEAVESIGEAINTTVAELESATDDIAAEVERLSANSEEVAAAAGGLVDTAETAVETGRSGREAADSAISEMESAERTAGEAVSEVETLRTELREIEETVTVITEIARRTNILAVNARIESSRSDESRGYSVVSDEIRDLAEESERAARQIERRIEVLRSQAEDTAVKITGTRERTESAAAAVREAVDAFDRLADYADDVEVNARSISSATDDQVHSVQSVAAGVDDLTSIATAPTPAETAGDAEGGFERVSQD